MLFEVVLRIYRHKCGSDDFVLVFIFRNFLTISYTFGTLAVTIIQGCFFLFLFFLIIIIVTFFSLFVAGVFPYNYLVINFVTFDVHRWDIKQICKTSTLNKKKEERRNILNALSWTTPRALYGMNNLLAHVNDPKAAIKTLANGVALPPDWGIIQAC